MLIRACDPIMCHDSRPLGSLIGADRGGLVCHRNFDRVTIALREVYKMDKDIAEHLVSNYGTRALQLAEMAMTEPDGKLIVNKDGRRYSWLDF